jgi:hypothetical protein
MPKTIFIDYSDKNIWIAWDADKGRDSFPRLEVCGNPARLSVIMGKRYPEAKIVMSEAAEFFLDPMFFDYIGSSIHKFDLSQ